MNTATEHNAMEYFKCHSGQLFVCVLVFQSFMLPVDSIYCENKNLSFDFITVCKARTPVLHTKLPEENDTKYALVQCTHKSGNSLLAFGLRYIYVRLYTRKNARRLVLRIQQEERIQPNKYKCR